MYLKVSKNFAKKNHSYNVPHLMINVSVINGLRGNKSTL